jgi:hypothetical protein
MSVLSSEKYFAEPFLVPIPLEKIISNTPSYCLSTLTFDRSFDYSFLRLFATIELVLFLQNFFLPVMTMSIWSKTLNHLLERFLAYLSLEDLLQIQSIYKKLNCDILSRTHKNTMLNIQNNTCHKPKQHKKSWDTMEIPITT